MANYRLITNLLLLLGIAGTMIVLLFTPPEHRDLITIVGIIGTFASVFGVIFALIQISSLKRTTLTIQKEVNKATQNFTNLLSVADLGKSKKLIDEIQLFLQGDNLSGSIIRLKDLKETLIQYRYNLDLQKWTETKEYRSYITSIGLGINTLSDFILGVKDASLNKSTMVNELENIRTKIIEFESELKYNRHDS